MMGSRGPWHLCAFVLAGLLAGCGGGGGDGPGIVNAPVVISVTVSPTTTNPIDIGASVQLSANVEVQNGASQSVDWTSSALNVATVSQTGLVTGVGGGSATITATSTANRTKTGSAPVTINPPRVVDVTLNSGARTIRIAENFAVAATVQTLGTLARTVTFTTSNAAVATVTSTDGLTATIVGVAAGGPVTITARSTADATKSATLAVTVTGTVRIPVVNPPSVNIRAGTSVKLVPTVQPDPGVSSAVTFQSQNIGVATVAADGTVFGVVPGLTSVIVRSVGDPTVSVTVPVTIRGGVTSVSLSPDRDSLRRGGTRQLTLQVVTETGVSNAVVLTSANPAIATIDGTARVTAAGVGQTYVRALATADPSVGDSTLIVVLDPCTFFTRLSPSVQLTGTVNDFSCNGVDELFSVALTQQTTFSMSATPQFPMNFTVLGDKSGGWFTAGAANVATSFLVVATPNRYYLRVSAQSVSQRGQFTIIAVPNAPITACNVVATTGITVSASLNACGFTPQNRPAGNYNSVNFAMLPVLQPGNQLTVTVTAPAGIFPLVEVRFGSNPPVQAIATGTTLVQTFTAPAVAGFTQVMVSTRDALQVGTVTVKIEGPPSISYDAFVFGSGVIESTSRGRRAPQLLRLP